MKPMVLPCGCLVGLVSAVGRVKDTAETRDLSQVRAEGTEESKGRDGIILGAWPESEGLYDYPAQIHHSRPEELPATGGHRILGWWPAEGRSCKLKDQHESRCLPVMMSKEH